jgi:hypothetical protein
MAAWLSEATAGGFTGLVLLLLLVLGAELLLLLPCF